VTTELLTVLLPSLASFGGAMLAVKTEITWIKKTQDKLDKRITALEKKAAV
jgi:hypothetical protein